jgi:hypothetical protein
MRLKRLKLLLAILAGLVALTMLMACGNGDEEQGTSNLPTRESLAGDGNASPAATVPTTASPAATVPTTASPNEPVVATPPIDAESTPDQAVPAQAARADLANRLGVDIGEIDVVSVEAIQWSNACLGAARPDEACAEVITPGYRVVLGVGGTEYVYHTDSGTHVRPAP